MATFLDNLSEYNAKAAVAISAASLAGEVGRSTMMSSLKSTANDTTLSSAARLEALTALINLGNLLDVALPPYFPVVVEYANTQTYVGIHNDLSGLQGGAPGEYYHLTAAEKANILNKVSPSELQFANLTDSPYDNALLSSALGSKQDALVGTGLVRSTAGTITYDTNVYLTAVSGPAGGDLTGTYPNPSITSATIMGKLMTGWNPLYPTGTGAISAADSLLTAIQKLNATVNAISPSGVSSVSLTMPSSVFSYTGSPASGAVALGASFVSQSANTFFAAPDGTSGTPSFRLLVSDDIPNLAVSPAGTYGGGSPLQIPVITVDAKGRVTSVSTVSATGSGTVTSVNIDPPNYFVAGSPVTTAGDITLSWDTTITPNFVLAGPSSGVSTAAPTFRALVQDDIPSLDPSKITGLTALLSTFLTGDLSDGKIWIGNTSNAATPRTLTGDVTVDNTGVTAIGTSKVQYSMIQDVTAQTLLGRYELTNGVVQQVTLSGDFVLDDMTGVLSLSSPIAPILTTKGDLLSFTTTQDRLPSSTNDGDVLMVYNTASNGFGLQWNTISGDVYVADPSSGEMRIDLAAVTLAKMADLPAYRVIGNDTSGTATPKALTKTELTTLVNQFSSTLAGVVPASGGGTANYLRADGTWQPVSAGGTVTTVSVVSAHGFAGTVANATSTPAITLTTTVTGVLKGNGTDISAASAGTDYIAPGAVTASGLTMTSSRLLGRTTVTTGAIEEISVGASLSLSSTTLSLNTGNANTWTALQTFQDNIYLGEVSGSAGSARFLGSTSGYVALQAPAAPANQTYTLPTAYPASSSGYYLSSTTSGTLSWVAVTSGTTTNALTIDNSGSGAASGATFNGSSAVTISYNTIGAPSTSGTNATGTWGISITGNAATVTNGLYSTGSYSNPTWLTSISGGIVSGNISGNAANVTGTVALANGGTNSNLTAVAGAVAWSNSSSIVLTAAGSSGQMLQSAGTSSPVWTTATYPSTTTSGRILVSTANNVIGEIAAPTVNDTYLKWNGGVFSWATAGGGTTPPGGSTTEVQYNNAGAFGGIPQMTYVGGFVQIQTPKIGTGGGNGHYHVRGATSTPGGIANYVTQFVNTSPKQIGYIFETDAYESYILFGATADRTYTLPDATGSVLLDTVLISINNGTSAGEIRFKEATANGSNYVAMKAPSLLSSDYSLTLPSTAPGSGQTLISDSSGNLSWSSNPGTTGAKFLSTVSVATVTGTTAETVLQQLLIPANTYTVGDTMQLIIRARRQSQLATDTWKFYISNQSNVFSGKPQLGLFTIANIVQFGFTVERFVTIYNATTTYYVNSATARYTDFNNDNLSSSNIDWTVDQYIIVTTIPATTGQQIFSVNTNASPS